MADNTESIGGVSVLIGGDYAPLLTAFGQAQSAAQSAGTAVASAFNAGAGRATGLVDQFGRAIQSTVAPTAAATAAQAGLAAATEASTAALGHQVSQLQATSGAIRTALGEQSIRAAERFLSMIPGVGAALQLAFPVIGALALLDALDRVIDKTIGLQAAEENLAEATHLADEQFKKTEDTLNRITVEHVTAEFGKARGLAAQGSIDTEKLKEDQAAIDEIADHIKILQAAQGSSSGTTIAFLAELSHVPLVAGMGRDALKAQADEVKTLQRNLREAQDKLREDQGQRANTGETGMRAGVEESGSLAVISAANQEKAAERVAQSALTAAQARIKGEHDVRQASIDSMEDVGERAIASALERITVAKDTASAEITAEQAITKSKIDGINARAAAESQGKAEPETKKIAATASGDIATAQAEGTEKGLAAMRAVYEAENQLGEAYATAQRGWGDKIAEYWIQALDKVEKKQRETFIATNLPPAINESAEAGASQITAKGSGQEKDLQIEAQKLQYERDYGAEITHSNAERVEYAQRIAGFEAQARAAKLAGLQADLALAQTAADEVKGTEKYVAALKTVARLKVQITDLSKQNANADAKDQAAIDDLNRKLTQTLTLQQQITNAKNAAGATLQTNQQNIGTNLGNAIGNLPKSVGDDIGSSISNALLGHHPGKSIGQEMAKALEDSLKSTAANLLKQGISSVFQEILVKAKQSISPTSQQGGAIGAPTGAGGVTTGATIPTGSPGAGTPIYGTGTAAAAGGATPGQIVQVKDQIAEQTLQQILRAIQQTNSTLSQQTALNRQWQQVQTALLNSIATWEKLIFYACLLNNLGGGLLGDDGGGGDADGAVSEGSDAPSSSGGESVTSTVSYGKALADGGSPPVGVPSLVGERGPELFVPHSAGVVISNDALNSYASGAGDWQRHVSYASSSSAFSEGSHTFHFHMSGVSNGHQVVDHVMRELPTRLKARSSKFARYSK